MAPRLLSMSDFARLAGVQPSTVTRASKKALAACVVVDRIDAGHPVALAWVDRQRRRKGR
jgi:hypothetical protein